MRNPGLLFSAALIVASVACSSVTDRHDRFVERGGEAEAAGRTSEAIIAYRNAVQLDPLSAKARLRLADTLAKSGDAPAALGEYVRRLISSQTTSRSRSTPETCSSPLENLTKPALARNEVLQKDPTHVEAHILLGNALGGYQNLDEALAQMEEAIRLDPTRAASHLQLGIVQQAQGKSREAESALKRAVELAPKWPGGHMALGGFYLSTGQLSDAGRALDAALALEPSHVGANRAKAVLAFREGHPENAESPLKTLAATGATAPQVALGDYYIAIGKFQEAVAVFEGLAKDSRTQLAVMPRLVRAHASAGNMAAARDLIDRLLQENPDNHAIRALESQVLLDQGQRERALESAQRAAKGDPTSAVAQFTLGKAYAAVGDRPGAESAFREVLKINPRATPAQVELSMLHLGDSSNSSLRIAQAAVDARPESAEAKLALIRGLLIAGDLTRAEREIAQLQAQKPTAAGYAQAGALALARAEFSKARTAFDKALELSPDSIEALAGHISIDLRQGNPVAARTRLSLRLAAERPQVEVLLLAARTYLSLNDLKESEAVLRRAIELEPASLPAYSMLGQTYLRLNRLDDAIAEFDRLAARQTRPIGALTAAGTILQAQGRNDEARERFQRAVGLDPAAAVAANNLAWIYAESGEHLDEAIRLAQSALERLPDVPDVLDTLGWVYYKSDLPAQAVRPLSRCIAVAPQNAPCYYHLGLVQAKLGDPLAEQNLRTSLQLQGSAPWAADARRALATLATTK